jgi:microcystin-dependent protein
MDPYVGEIRMFAGTYAPVGWALCDGSLLNVSQYEVLFSLLGTTWGGNGSTNFGLPDLRGRLPVGQGQGAGLTNQILGPGSGTETVTLTQAMMPAHNHPFNASSAAATATVPGSALTFATANYTPAGSYTPKAYVPYAAANTTDTLAAATISQAGQSQAHNDVMPSLVINYIIATTGIYPSRP